MVKVGEITAVKGDLLEVTFCRDEDCGHCHACDGKSATPMKIKVPGSGSVGDYAAVELPTGTVAQAALMAYGLPIAGILGGMLLGTAVGGNLGAAIGGGIGFVLAIVLVRVTESRRQRSGQWQPMLQEVLPRSLYEKKEEAAQP